MPELTRRRYRERQDCWHIYYGDVHVGTIARRVGIPPSGRAWGWICGFYPGSEPGEFRDGTAATFDQARADFEVAWSDFRRNGLKPTIRPGATSGTGLPRSTAGSIGASGLRTTLSWRRSMVDRQ